MSDCLKTTGITRVEKRDTGWRITDTEGVRYFTRNAWKASLCDQARLLGRRALLKSYAGWYYRDLDTVNLLDAVSEAQSQVTEVPRQEEGRGV